jgi:hypothetical protein
MRTHICKEERMALGFKAAKDQVSVMLGSNTNRGYNLNTLSSTTLRILEH